MSEEPRMAASPWFAVGQLQRAFDSLAAAQDAAGLARAEAKIARWRSVLAGMADGSLAVGTRTPVTGTPEWVTLEVAHGGFATGRLLAEQPLDADERELLGGLPREVPGATDRERLNAWFLGDAGQRDLRRMLAEGRYRVEVPEEAALLVVAWLLEHGPPEAALDLVAELRPWMSRLRFTPPAGGPARAVRGDGARPGGGPGRPAAEPPVRPGLCGVPPAAQPDAAQPGAPGAVR
jgi:hypothetical protein